MSTKKEIPVLLLTGYLGSGKTTLVNHILTNERGVKFAVIVNDIGEVNIDADLIQKGGVVGAKDDSLVALQNGCICCTLKMDLVEQVYDLVKSGKFDYIVIEASGVCEPAPIAQTICSIPRLGEAYRKYGIARLDCIVTVVDALRLQDEFGGGDNLTRKDIGEEDIENLIIQQIEFCNRDTIADQNQFDVQWRCFWLEKRCLRWRIFRRRPIKITGSQRVMQFEPQLWFHQQFIHWDDQITTIGFTQ